VGEWHFFNSNTISEVTDAKKGSRKGDFLRRPAAASQPRDYGGQVAPSPPFATSATAAKTQPASLREALQAGDTGVAQRLRRRTLITAKRHKEHKRAAKAISRIRSEVFIAIHSDSWLLAVSSNCNGFLYNL
jgi:hypothetical protein